MVIGRGVVWASSLKLTAKERGIHEQRLVALNAERAAEEERGLVRWLRPEFQAPDAQQGQIDLGDEDAEVDATAAAVAVAEKRPWPKTLPEQFAALASAVSALPGPADAEMITRLFKRARVPTVTERLDSMVALGHVSLTADGAYAA